MQKKDPNNWLEKVDGISDKTEENYFALFPDEEELQKHFDDIFVFNRPIGKVGSNGYWLYQKEHTVFLALFDCIGEGHLASMMTRVYAKALKKLVIDYKIEFPGSILQFIHREIQARFKNKKNAIMHTGADLGIVKFDLKEKVVDFAGARMDLWHLANGSLDVIEGDELQIGELFEAKHEYNTVKIKVDGSSQFYLMSNGIKRLAGGPNMSHLGDSHLKNAFLKTRDKNMEEQKNYVIEIINDWKGAYAQSDDIMLIGFKF